MFGFLKRAAIREHSKLMYQNGLSVNFIAGFDPELASSIEQQVSAINRSWVRGEMLNEDHAKLMLAANKALRKAYDKTPARFAKTFDEEYAPLLGWREYHSRLEG